MWSSFVATTGALNCFQISIIIFDSTPLLAILILKLKKEKIYIYGQTGALKGCALSLVCPLQTNVYIPHKNGFNNKAISEIHCSLLSLFIKARNNKTKTSYRVNIS